MLNRLFPTALLLFIVQALPSAAASADPVATLRQPGTASTETITISADTVHYDKASNAYTATGGVRIDRDGLTLRADRALYNSAGETAVAEGNVVVERGDDVLRGERISLDIPARRGHVRNGSLFVKSGNFHLLGSEIEKLGEDTYRVARGTFTTCDGELPSWKFTASELVVDETFAKGKDAVFYLADVPVLYLPYVVFPAARSRQSGFLMPRLGHSTKKGFYTDIPFYVDIAPSQDATVEFDGETNRGAGFYLDYRYLLSKGGGGELSGLAFFDTQKNTLRGEVTQKHEVYFSPTLSFKSAINFASDKDFYRDFGEGTGDYNRRTLISDVFVTKNWSYGSLTPGLRYLTNLDDSDRTTLQKLPTVTFTGAETPVTGPFSFQIDASMINFQREEGSKGQRVELHPRVSLYFHPGVFDLRGWADYAGRFYNAYNADQGEGQHLEGIPQAGLALSTMLQRVFTLDGATALRHLVVPEISYHVRETSDAEIYPVFDYDDRLPRQNVVEWSLTNYLTKRSRDGENTSYSDVLRLRLSQDLLLSGSRLDLLSLRDDSALVGDLRLEANVSPLSYLTLTTDARYDPRRNKLHSIAQLVDLADGSGNLLGAGYRYFEDGYRYLEMRAGVTLVKPFSFQYTGRYSIDPGKLLESYYSLEYRHQCWSIATSYRDRLDEKAFMLTFTLSGIGSLGSIRAL